MKNSKALFADLMEQLRLPEREEEIRTMVYMVLQNLFSLSHTDVLAEKQITLNERQAKKLQEIVHRLNANEPIQYVLGEADFYGRKFYVDEAVLIPRPETEELVRLVIDSVKSNRQPPIRIADIGTGSGCIPITLALALTDATVFGTDISDGAIAIATQNAKRLKADVSFFNHDVRLDEFPVRDLDVVVSNPPYVTLAEKSSMTTSVHAFEPHLALFVPDDDPLLFYKAVANTASTALRSSGLLAVEINERFGREVASLFEQKGFVSVQIFRDLFNKERIVKGILP